MTDADSHRQIDKAKERVELSIHDAKMYCLDKFEWTLREIANLPVTRAWRAPQMAEEALQIGQYWCKGFTRDSSPKNLFAYYFWYFWRFITFRTKWGSRRRIR